GSRTYKQGHSISDPVANPSDCGLQRGLNFEAPSFQQRLLNVLGILVAPRPLPQASGTQILVRREFVLPHNLFKFSDSRGNRANRLGLAPVGISASFRHEKCLST